MGSRLFVLAGMCAALLLGCASGPEPVVDRPQEEPAAPTTAPVTSGAPAEPVFGDDFPEVLAVTAEPISQDLWRFNVTLSSLYDAPDRYADAWRVLDESDVELGIRILGHDHASEQPFTRSHSVQVPVETTVVWVEGRDQVNGWSGQRFEVPLQ